MLCWLLRILQNADLKCWTLLSLFTPAPGLDHGLTADTRNQPSATDLVFLENNGKQDNAVSTVRSVPDEVKVEVCPVT